MSDIFDGEPRYTKNQIRVASAQFEETFGNPASDLVTAKRRKKAKEKTSQEPKRTL
jgi:hypothetical protein